MCDKKAITKSLSEKPVFGTPSPRPLLTSSTLEPTMRPVSNIPDLWSPLRHLDNLPPLPTFEPFDKKLAPNTTAPTHVGKPPPLPSSESFEKKLTPNPTAFTTLPTSESLEKKLSPNTTAPTHDGKPSPLPTFEPFDKKLAPNTTAFTTLPTSESFEKKLSPNTTVPTHVGKPSHLPTSESFEKKLASNMTDSRSEYYNKLLGLFTFNPNSKELASNTSLFHLTPFKPINDGKPLKMPDYKPKLNLPSPAPASGQTGPLVIAKAIAGLSGCTVIIVLICCCIYSKRINQTQKERRPRRDNGLRPWCYGSEHSFNLDLGDDPPRYSYTDPEDTELHNYRQEIDVTLEMGTDLSFDMNCYDNDTGGGSSNDCVQD